MGLAYGNGKPLRKKNFKKMLKIRCKKNVAQKRGT